MLPSHSGATSPTAVPGTTAAKGQESGFFQFGGSDIIVLLQAGIDDQVDTSPDPRTVGSVIATARPRG